MIRGIVLSIAEGVIKRFSATGRCDETISDREYFQHYGYTSRPQAGAEIIIIREGGHFVAVASDDRRYRIALEDGEVALYTDEGDKIHFKRDRIIEIIGGEKVIVTTKVAEITATTSATVISPEVTVVASTKVTLTTPLLDVSGDIKSGGNITAVGDVADAISTMAGMRTIYNSHTHQEHGTGGGITSPTTQGM
jgi:phage baseplate assembly protein V